ncbi:MAG: (Fe-S)-binding protein [Archaeoglobaceae archaeon]
MLSTCIQCGVCSSSCSMRFNMNLRKSIALFLNKRKFWSEDLWNCTNCMICQERCPRGIKLVEIIRDSRAERVELGNIPKEIRDMFENIKKFQNPFGAIKKPKFDADIAKKGEFDYLLFIGCSAYDPRVKEIVDKAIKLLKLAKIKFAILENEKCCGNEVMALGEIGLFGMLMDENKQIFDSIGVEKVITISPHCYNALRNYYKLETFHISEILLEKIQKAEIKFSKVFEGKVTYHDPCYLSRHNRIVLEPRELLESIPGLELIEMQRNKEFAICCGGGSGGIVRDFRWKPSLERVGEAMLTGAEFLAVSCPFCLIMLEDAAKLKNTGLKVLDLVEILYESVF